MLRVLMSKMTDTAATPAAFQLTRLKGVDLFEVTIDQLQDHYEQGRFTCADYVDFCLERLRKVRASIGLSR